MLRAVRGLAVLGALSLVACGAQEPAATGGANASADLPFETFTVAEVAVADERLIDGRIEGVQQATVTAQVPGQVVAVLRDAESSVAAGEPVLRVRATQVQGGLAQTEAALVEATALAVDAETRYQRIAALYERKVVPRAGYEQALAQRDSAVARRDAARAARDAAAAYTLVRAPFDGVVTERAVRVGDSVAPGMPLFGLAATRQLRVRAELPESLVSAARRSREVVLLHRGQRLALRNVLIFPGAQARDGSFGLQADLPAESSGLAPGMLVKLGVVEGQRQGLRIPATAVIERGEVTGVYVQSPTGMRFRQLRLGASANAEVEVLAGLAAGEIVALRASEALSAQRAGAQAR